MIHSHEQKSLKKSDAIEALSTEDPLIYNSPQTITPQKIFRLQQTIGNQAVQRMLHQKSFLHQSMTQSLTIQRKASDVLRTQNDIIYGEPALNEQDARALIEAIEVGDPQVLQTYAGRLKCKGQNFIPQTSDQKHEWGLGKDREDNTEVFLIKGKKTSTSWDEELVALVVPIAHSHPFFKEGSARVPARRGSGTVVSTSTKEIADHPNLPAGFVKWDEITKVRGNRSVDASNEMAKIFPSGSDIEFCAKKGVDHHTVYTTYIVGNDNNGDRVVGNPAHTFQGQQLPFNPSTFPLLSFEILQASVAQTAQNDNDNASSSNSNSVNQTEYTCTMVAKMGTQQIWQKTVSSPGGQFGPLYWS